MGIFLRHADAFLKLKDIRDVAKKIPLEGCSLNGFTFLAPVPYEEKATRPAYVVETARSLAQLRTLSLKPVGK